uniref:Uncharacterized protein n=1 Tax=Panagrolaimus sp. ES5 TaxID=591445 RepID=A0AC34FAT3_9BILA
METKTLFIFSIVFIIVLATPNVNAQKDKAVHEPKVAIHEPKMHMVDGLRAKRGNAGVFNLDGLTARGHPSGHGK